MTLAGSETLIARASRQTGLDNFGPEGWREGLERLVASFSEADLGESVNAKIEARLEAVLAQRLRVEDWIARHPDTLDGQIEGPVVILGLPRTATTALHGFLATDPRWRYLRNWETAEPIPPPDIANEATDPRMLDELADSNSGSHLHIHEAGAPVDDSFQPRLNFHNHEFSSPAWSYTRWWRDCDMTSTYAYHERMLKLLQSRRPPNRWLVKAPSHLMHIETLAAQYPAARLIMCHRDPVKVVGSTASMFRSLHRNFHGADVTPPERIGAHVLEHLAVAANRALAFRRRHGDSRFIDVGHREFNADPFGELSRIYAGLGLDLSPDVRPAMEAWQSRNRRGARGEHHYAIEDFGLNEDQVRSAFAEYKEKFNV
jgi:hypothetical protein